MEMLFDIADKEAANINNSKLFQSNSRLVERIVDCSPLFMLTMLHWGRSTVNNV